MIMDQAIITASKGDIVSLHHPSADVLALLGPTIRYAGYIQTVISSLSIFLGLQAYAIASVTFAAALYASRILAWQAHMAAKLGAFYARLASAKAASEVYRSKTLKLLRKKIFFEFAVFILGSGGNAMILLVFWPGWIVIGGGAWAVWRCVG